MDWKDQRPSNRIDHYFETTASRETREDLKLAVSLVNGNKVAIDCGCGAGSDIAYLSSRGFLVHAFDLEEKSISLCRERFKHDNNVTLTQASFSSFVYPRATLVIADASLFYCPARVFGEVWDKITNALQPGGVFCGSFLGPEDTMAQPDYDSGKYWSDILVFTKKEASSLFSNFQVESFVEHRVSGTAPDGAPHQWHLFSVVAKKMTKTSGSQF